MGDIYPFNPNQTKSPYLGSSKDQVRPSPDTLRFQKKVDVLDDSLRFLVYILFDSLFSTQDFRVDRE